MSQKYSVIIPLENLTLKNLNIYAAQTLDRYHLNNLNISFDDKSIVNLNNQENNIEQWTVDKDTAFHIGWDLTIVPQIKFISNQQAKQVFSFSFFQYSIECFLLRVILITVIIKRIRFILIFIRKTNVFSIIQSM